MTSNPLEIDVQHALEWEPGLDAGHIVVAAGGGAVTLSGHDPADFGPPRAVAAAGRVRGVRAVADEIEVHLHDINVREDSEIARTVAHLLQWNTMLASQPVQAEVSNGRVTLTGRVDWNHEKDEAARVVDRVLGVKSVVHLVTVKPRAVAAQVEEQIADALTRHAALDAREIHVATSGTRVLLTGLVHSLDEDRIARAAAWSAPGITDVEDHLLVQP